MGWRDRPFAPEDGTVLCGLDDIADGGVKEFVFGERQVDGSKPFRMIVVRWDEEVRGYLNICPHFRLPLNIQGGPFLTPAREVIECANHFARFRFEDGTCVEGVCQGDRLRRVPVHLSNKDITVGSQ